MTHQKIIRTMHFFIAIIVGLCSCGQNSEQEIAQWRGPERTGIYPEEGLLDSWPEQGPELLWTFEGIGRGYASPTVTGEYIFVNGEEEGQSFLYAFNMEGELQWKAPNGAEFLGTGYSATYPGSRSAPTVKGGLVYATSGQGRLACFDMATGMEKWNMHLVKDLGGLESMFGYSESVIVDNGKVYCFPGGNENNTVALDMHTGEIVWSADALKDTFSYCSPQLVSFFDKKILVAHSRHNLYTMDSENGHIQCSFPIHHYEYDGEHCNTPVFENGYLYFVGNEKELGAIKLEVTKNGGQMKEIWRNTRVKNNFGGFIKLDDKIYTTVKGNWLKVLDAQTGTVSDSVKVATGSLIFADNKFICYGMNGEVSLIDNSGDSPNVKSTFKVMQGDGHHFSHPVLSQGVMYLRHGNALVAYRIK